jgi:peptidyl-tRNA hydrolase, PTH1 family
VAAELWLLVGLGNPGRRYQGNRHNVGFLVADALASAGEDLQPRAASKFAGELAKGTLDGKQVLLLKPQTYMNLSGRSVAAVSRFYEVPLERMVVIHDDVDLELGRLRVKAGGGDGGHKGIRSMAQELGSPEFLRVRAGIGRPEVGEVEDFVLQDFRLEERAVVDEMVARAGEAVRAVLGGGLKEAMNRFNGPTDRQDKKADKEEQ